MVTANQSCESCCRSDQPANQSSTKKMTLTHDIHRHAFSRHDQSDVHSSLLSGQWRMRHCPMVILLVISFILHGASAEMSFLVEPKDQSAALGQTVVFSCSLRNLVGSVQWMQGGFGLGTDRALGSFERYSMIGSESKNEYNLQIQEVTLDDEQTYECQVSPSELYPRGLRSAVVRLSVIVPPQRPTIIEGPKVPVKLHTTTPITCRADRGKPAAEIRWHLNGVRLMRGVTSQQEVRGSYFDTISTLNFNATLADAGKTLECDASTDYMAEDVPHYKTSATLDVQYPPNIDMRVNITSQNIREHDYVRIECLGSANPARIVWIWYRNNTIIPGATTNTLDIPNISYKWNANRVTCVANHTAGIARESTVLNVKFGAKIIDITEVVGADPGKTARLACVVKGNPAPHIVWKRMSSSPAKIQPSLSTRPVYKINPVRKESYGIYLCTASVPGFPVSSREARLVRNKPPVMMSEKQQSAAEGDHGRLECRTNSIPKPTSFSWSRHGETIDYARSGRLSMEEKDLTFGRKYILHFQKVKSSDFGYYNCTVINDYGIAYDQIELVEKHVLPITFIIIGIFACLGFIIIVCVICCIIYRRRKKDDQGSVLGSYTDTESSSDKKREKADSPTTLMGQLRQDYNKDMYRFSADYDDVPYKEQNTKGNNNGYGVIGSYEAYSDQPVYDGDYVPVQRGDDLLPDRYDNVYNSGTGYSFSSFSRGNNFDNSTPPPTMSRLTPLHVTDSKLATDV